MRRLVQLAVFLPALVCYPSCGSTPRRAEPLTIPTPYCFRMLVRTQGPPRVGVACGETAELCSWAQEKAIAAGRWTDKLLEIGECRREEKR